MDSLSISEELHIAVIQDEVKDYFKNNPKSKFFKSDEITSKNNLKPKFYSELVKKVASNFKLTYLVYVVPYSEKSFKLFVDTSIPFQKNNSIYTESVRNKPKVQSLFNDHVYGIDFSIIN